MIEDVADFLACNTSLRKGINLFQGNMPEAPTDCVALYDTGGQEPYQESTVDNPTIQVVCRGSKNNYAKAMAQAREIFELLNRKLNFTIGTIDCMKSQAIASPQVLPLDKKMRWKVVVNYTFKIRVP